MIELSDTVAEFLQTSGWGPAERQPLAGDMSSRRYSRLSMDSRTAILMESSAPCTDFARMTDWLAGIGLSVPKILSEKSDMGLLLLEDFGDTSLKSELESRLASTTKIFQNCISVLLKIRAADPPALTAPDAHELMIWTAPVWEHYAVGASASLQPLRERLCDILERALKGKRTVSLRDFHSENIMWLPARSGYAGLGLLDYQDAFLTHPVYDLMSLLTDARTWVSREIRQDVLRAYLRRSGDSSADFTEAFAAFSIQRNLRILGVFAAAKKPPEAMVPTYRYLSEALEHPAFREHRNDVLKALPDPESAS